MLSEITLILVNKLHILKKSAARIKTTYLCCCLKEVCERRICIPKFSNCMCSLVTWYICDFRAADEY